MTVESGDPLDRPPLVDHGSDRYDYVEVDGPAGCNPEGTWWDLIVATPCPDCRANVFARFLYDPEHRFVSDRKAWHITIAHDETCPAQNARERDGG